MSVTIDGVSVNTQSRVIETINVDDEIRNTIIIIKDTVKAEAYDTDLLVVETDGVNTNYFLTGKDDFVLTARNPFRYTHTITLIGLEKKLEKETMVSLQYTQPLDTTRYTKLDILDRALKLIKLEEFADLGSNRVYDISGVGTRDTDDNYVVGNLSGLALRLYNDKAPEFKWDTPTLKEICDDVLDTIDGRTIINSIVSGVYIIDVLYYNEKTNEIDINDVEEINGSQSIEKNAQGFDVYMENAISENNLDKQAVVYPSPYGWASVRSASTELTTLNFNMPVNDEIERVLKLELYADVTINYTDATLNTQTFNGVLEVDMTDYIYTKDAWDALLYEFTSWIYAKWKNNTLYFDGNEIKAWHEDIDIFTIFGSIKQWHLILGQMLVESAPVGGVSQISLSALNKPKFNNGADEFMYRITYVPKTKSRIILEKDSNTAVGRLYANQTDRVVDIERLGVNLQSKLNREGNKELIFTKQVKSLSNVFDLTDYYGDYVVHKVVNDKFIDSTNTIIKITSTAFLGKNYAKRSERMTISNKPRQTDISKVTTFRNDVIQEYIYFGDLALTNDSYIGQTALERYAELFNQGATVYDDPINLALVITRDSTTTLINQLLIPCNSQGVANTLHFKWGFNSNVVAGIATETLDTIEGNAFKRYADDSGLVDTVEFDLCDAWIADTDTYANRVINAKLLPVYSAASMDINNRMIEVPELYYIKDSGEEMNITYQAKHYSDTDFFVGNRAVTNNPLVVKTPETLFLYSSTTKFDYSQVIKASASQKTIVNSTTPGAGQIGMIVTVGVNRIQLTLYDVPTGYWALGNANRDTYYICNKLNEDIVFLAPQKERND